MIKTKDNKRRTSSSLHFNLSPVKILSFATHSISSSEKVFLVQLLSSRSVPSSVMEQSAIFKRGLISGKEEEEDKNNRSYKTVTAPSSNAINSI